MTTSTDVFHADVTVTDGGKYWNTQATVQTGGREYSFDKSYAKTGWTAGQAGTEALTVIVDRVHRGSI